MVECFLITEIRGAANPAFPAARSRQGHGNWVFRAEEQSRRRPEEAELAEEPEFSGGHGNRLAEQPQ